MFGNATYDSIDRMQMYVYIVYNVGLNLNYTKIRRWVKIYKIYMQNHMFNIPPQSKCRRRCKDWT